MDDETACVTPIVDLLRGSKLSDGWRTYSEKPDDPMAGSHNHGDLMERAADEIDSLRTENERLKREYDALFQAVNESSLTTERSRAEQAERERDEAVENLRIQEKLSRAARKVSARCIVEKDRVVTENATLTRELKEADMLAGLVANCPRCRPWASDFVKYRHETHAGDREGE